MSSCQSFMLSFRRFRMDIICTCSVHLVFCVASLVIRANVYNDLVARKAVTGHDVLCGRQAADLFFGVGRNVRILQCVMRQRWFSELVVAGHYAVVFNGEFIHIVLGVD
ncbi:hypothetical protein B2J86_08080 [Acidovorax sp. SRB_14]|nr:hypothetical protein [Acidovorax sp. SRB_14]